MSDGRLIPERLYSVCIWAAHNAKPNTRGKMLAPLLRAFLGLDGRDATAQARIGQLANEEILRVVFEDDQKRRKAVARKKGARS